MEIEKTNFFPLLYDWSRSFELPPIETASSLIDGKSFNF